jgi:hypothetical protein
MDVITRDHHITVEHRMKPLKWHDLVCWAKAGVLLVLHRGVSARDLDELTVARDFEHWSAQGLSRSVENRNRVHEDAVELERRGISESCPCQIFEVVVVEHQRGHRRQYGLVQPKLINTMLPSLARRPAVSHTLA